MGTGSSGSGSRGLSGRSVKTDYKLGEFSKEQRDFIKKTFDDLQKKYPLTDKDALQEVIGNREKYGLDLKAEDYDVEDYLYEHGILDAHAEYTPMKDYGGLNSLRVSKDKLFMASDSMIKMDKMFEHMHELFQRGIKQTGLSDMAGFGAQYVLTHEYGHILARSVGMYKSMKGANELYNYWKNNRDKIRNQISGYASQNWDEAFAEAFAQSFSRYQSQASKEMMQIYKRARKAASKK